jgi:hypothetical protein
VAEIFIVMDLDRHSDPEPYPFINQEKAVEYAQALVARNCRNPEWIEEPELTDGMRARGWVWHCRYGIEGDSVHVVRKELKNDWLRFSEPQIVSWPWPAP